MQSIQISQTLFDIPLQFNEIDYFRKAVCSVVRNLRTPLLQQYIAPDLFYNHDDESNNPINRYPLIQYQVKNGKAAITGINQGATAIAGLLRLAQSEQNLYGTKIHINGRPANLAGFTAPPVKAHQISILDNLKSYRVNLWLPMEEERYAGWKESFDMTEKLSLLNEALPRQIAYFLRAVGFESELPFTAFITDIKKQEWVKEFNLFKLAFNCTFRSNLDLPDEIGIGQVPSIGFGKIFKL